MLTDIEIAQRAKLLPIREIGEKIGIKEEELIFYGKYKAKISLSVLDRLKDKPNAKMVLVTAMTPTPYGEGKTTISIGLTQAFWKLNKKSIVALREPSLGPVFGIKGGATGGGYSQVVPMEDINLHFTGDFHAVNSAHNLLSAMIDAHIHHGNSLNIDTREILWPRAIDMNDRSLRKIIVGLGGKTNGPTREDGFVITPASEVMAILGLSKDYKDLKERLGNILIGFKRTGEPVFARDLKAEGAMAAILRDALLPNLVQTLENTPAIIHTGPFGNIAHGTCSLLSILLSLKLSEIAVVEAGFGSDLGAEKFLNIVCQLGNFSPDAVVIVASMRGMKHHGGIGKKDLTNENIEAVIKGFENVKAHIENIRDNFGIPPIVAVNVFPYDTENEKKKLKELLENENVRYAFCEAWAKGGEGTIELAEKVISAFKEPKNYKPLYKIDMPLKEKIEIIAKKVYGADGVDYSADANKMLKKIEEIGLKNSF
ncbi:MAG: formate--tetrahydrofolate ligase, partial [candidate division WOR-3 bacterium]